MNRVRVRTAATAATAGNAACALWNPHASLAIRVFEIGFFATTAPAAGSTVVLKRISARGTQTATQLAGIENDTEGTTAATSTSTLDYTYSAQPTLLSALPNGLNAYLMPAVIGSGVVWPFPEGIRIPPGAGLALVAGAAVIVPVLDAYFCFDE